MMLRRDAAASILRDLEMNDEQDQGRLPCIVSCSTKLHQLPVLGLRKACPRMFTS